MNVLEVGSINFTNFIICIFVRLCLKRRMMKRRTLVPKPTVRTDAIGAGVGSKRT
jgi:hypothetical protein